jgi:DNA invertase Pin-like site-specific DNA recombinase
MAHNGPIPEGMSVCHRCDVRACINPDHLFLGSYADNLRDMREKGRWKRIVPTVGEASPNAKLTDATAMAIFSSKESQRQLAARYSVSKATVARIKNRKIWRHIHG